MDFTSFGAAVWLVVGALAILVITVPIALGLWCYLRGLCWRVARDRAAQKDQAAKTRPDGLLYPPAERGICDSCAKPFKKVYYLPSGQRYCPQCYERIEMPAAGGAPRSRRAEISEESP